MQSIEQELRAFLTENFVFSRNTDFRDDSSFLEMGLIDSTGMLELVAFLERKYGVVLTDSDLVPENLDSIESIARFLRQRLGTAEQEPALSFADDTMATGTA